MNLPETLKRIQDSLDELGKVEVEYVILHTDRGKIYVGDPSRPIAGVTTGTT